MKIRFVPRKDPLYIQRNHRVLHLVLTADLPRVFRSPGMLRLGQQNILFIVHQTAVTALKRFV